jgi:hypothetical protein
MAEATVSMDTGTIPTEVKTEVQTEVKAPVTRTLAEAEADYRRDYDAKHGRDITKLFPNVTPIKKEEVKTEVKDGKESKPEEKKTDAAVVPPVEKKAKGGYARTISRLNRELGAERERNRIMDDRLKALETGRTVTTTQPKVEEDLEPTRDKFETDLAWFQAVRAWDKKQLTKTTDDVKRSMESSVSDVEATRRWNEFVENKNKFESEHPDFGEVIEKSEVEFSPIIVGLLVDNGGIDPAFLYDMAMAPKEAKRLNELKDEAIAAIGSSSDMPTDVLRYLSKNPDDIKKLNGLDNPKQAKFVGIIESKVESARAAAKAAAGTETKKEEGKQAEPAKVEVKEVKETPPAEPVKRPKPEPPPKVTGAAPLAGNDDWRDPSDMSLAERERRYYADPRNKRR